MYLCLPKKFISVDLKLLYVYENALNIRHTISK